MTHYEGSYYRARAGQEEAAARAAVDLQIADIHWALAARYMFKAIDAERSDGVRPCEAELPADYGDEDNFRQSPQSG